MDCYSAAFTQFQSLLFIRAQFCSIEDWRSVLPFNRITFRIQQNEWFQWMFGSNMVPKSIIQPKLSELVNELCICFGQNTVNSENPLVKYALHMGMSVFLIFWYGRYYVVFGCQWLMVFFTMDFNITWLYEINWLDFRSKWFQLRARYSRYPLTMTMSYITISEI